MNTFSQLNLQIPDLWEVKDVINKVKNVVLNYTEMEAKVHEATNNEPWGASSTLMQEIAQGTYNYQYFNEIMPTLYKRFTEKEAKQWRQIYKALVLLEYLVKNGSERVIDDARSHISMIKIMRNFHYIDEKGKDQGVNIRNRAKELVDLLNDTDRIRMERKKARQNRNKYQGVGSDTIGGFGPRFGGFGSDTIGNGGFSSMGMGMSSGYYDEDERPNRYESSKYDDFDDTPSRDESSTSTSRAGSSSAASKTAAATSPKKEVNLFDFDDEPVSSAKSTKQDDDDEWGEFASGGVASGNGNDEFDDFQSAPPVNSSSAKPAASKTTTTNDLFDLLGNDVFASPAPATNPSPANLPPNTVQRPPLNPLMGAQSAPLTPTSSNPSNSRPASLHSFSNSTNANTSNNNNNNNQAANKPSSDLPSGIWSQASSFVSLDSLGKSSSPAKPAVGPSMNALKNSSINAGWSAWANSNQPSQQQQQQQQQQLPATTSNTNKHSSSAFDDLLSL